MLPPALLLGRCEHGLRPTRARSAAQKSVAMILLAVDRGREEPEWTNAHHVQPPAPRRQPVCGAELRVVLLLLSIPSVPPLVSPSALLHPRLDWPLVRICRLALQYGASLGRWDEMPSVGGYDERASDPMPAK